MPSRYTCFVIADPTPREILAPDFRDRIVHRWLVNSMEPFVDKRFLIALMLIEKEKDIIKLLLNYIIICITTIINII